MHSPESVQALLAPLFPGLMGVRLVEISAGAGAVAEMIVRPDLCAAGSILHGGACMAFVDTRGAVGTVLNQAGAKRTTTTDSSSKFVAAARVGTVVTGECIAPHRGRRTQVWQTTIRTAEGKLCAVVTQTSWCSTSEALPTSLPVSRCVSGQPVEPLVDCDDRPALAALAALWGSLGPGRSRRLDERLSRLARLVHAGESLRAKAVAGRCWASALAARALTAAVAARAEAILAARCTDPTTRYG